jgi:glycosyltransferase involved in cell wall biosynthesis
MNIAVLAPIDFESLFLCNDDRNIGGTSSVIKSITTYLYGEKIILFGITNDRNKSFIEKKISDNIIFVPIIYIPSNSYLPYRFLVLLKGRIIQKYLNEYGVDVIYSHSIELSYWIKNKFRYVQHLHGSTNALLLAKNKYFRFKPFIYIWEIIWKRVLAKSNKVIAIDNKCYSLARQYKDKEDVFYIPNFVDTNIFYNDQSSSMYLNGINGNKIALFVGRIEKVKGLELFIDVVKSLHEKDESWLGVIVGKGSYEESIKNYVIERLCEDIILFLGPVYDQNELRRIYSNANVVLITSYHEGIPMTVMESMACKTPVVSIDVGGIKEIATDGRFCHIINDRDPYLFAKKINELKSSKELNNQPFAHSVQNISHKINEILKSSAFRKKIFCPLSLPPPVYGSNISNKNVAVSPLLNEYYDMDVLRISYANNTNEMGVINIKKILLIIKYLLYILRKAFNNYDLVYYVPAVKGIAFCRDYLLLLPLKISKKKILLHLRGKGIYERAKNNIINKIFYKSFFKNTHVICLSESLTYDIKEVYKGAPYIVNNGINIEYYPPQKVSNDPPVILFLSNFIETKGIITLLDACRILKKRNIKFKLKLIGSPRDNIMEKIEESIHKCKLYENVISIGPKYGEEKKSESY